jgi:hypothetical protein
MVSFAGIDIELELFAVFSLLAVLLVPVLPAFTTNRAIHTKNPIP